MKNGIRITENGARTMKNGIRITENDARITKNGDRIMICRSFIIEG